MYKNQIVNGYMKVKRGIPFEIEYPEIKPEVLAAMEEAKRISRAPNIKGYTDVKKMF